MSPDLPAPGTEIPIRTLPNLRDLGGYLTSAGSKVKRGQLYRSVLLGRLSDDDLAKVRELGLKTVFDFRTAAEFEASPDREVGARMINLDVLADRTGEGPASLLAKMDDPDAVKAALTEGRGAELMRTAYRELIDLPSARRAYGTFFTELAGGDPMPALFHCTTGKDRTGWASAVTLLFLGVDEEDVYREYLLTNAQLLPALKPILTHIEEAGIEFDLLRPVIGVDRSYLETAIGLMKEQYQSIDGYMTKGLGLDDRTLEALRDRLTES
ncbi:MAG: tyrosine-protein phosphatase [Solirubrobacterales bacterium]|nr:tyrosine-protein phosphatase [Solirubrobacterales bacterium]MCB8916218.1 tyrosine-protein phosphatase [Thermoleophilales bacterium]